MNFLKDNNQAAAFIDSLELVLLGLASFLYSTFYRQFAELHIKLPILGLYVFAGEVLLGVCLLLLIIKWGIIKKDLNFPDRNLLLFFLGFILIKALWGYPHYGMLALRDSAMFYYFFFSVIAYDAYNNEFFNKWILSALLIILFSLLWSDSLKNYFLFTCMILAIISIMKHPVKIIKIIGMLAFAFWVLFRGKNFFFCPRGILLGHILGFFVLLSSAFILVKINKRYKIIISFVFVLIFALSVVKLGNKGRVLSLFNVRSLVDRYVEVNNFIKKNEKLYTMKEIIPKLYCPDPKGEPVESKIKEGKEKKVVLRIEHTREETTSLLNTLYSLGAAPRDISIVEKSQLVAVQKGNESFDGHASIQEPMMIPEEPVGDSAIEARKTDSKDDALITIAKVQLKPPQDRDKVLKEITKNSENIEIVQEAPQSSLVAFSSADAEIGYSTATFRLLIWQDMLKELWSNKAILGMSFGKPLRSKSVEITGMGYGEWSRDGWVFPHNTFMNIIYRSGIIGMILLILLFLSIFKAWRKCLKNESIVGIMLMSVIIYWLTIGFTFVLFELPYHAVPFWSLFGITFAYIYKKKESSI